MDEKLKLGIAYILLKRYLAKNVKLDDVGSLKRDFPNIAKETGISIQELEQFAKVVLPEIFQEQIKKLESRVKVQD